MSVSSITTASGSDLITQLNGTTGATATTSATSAKDLQSQFLAVLMAQLQNQDPTNPMDNAQMTSQLAQISTVEGISKLNDSVSSISSVFSSSQLLQAAGLVGHAVMAEGSDLTLANGQAAAGVKLATPADQVNIKIFDAQGTQVQSLDLGKQAAGFVPFVWDGKNASGATLADGAYTYSVSATQAGSGVTSTAYALNQIGSVATGSNGLSLQLQTGGSISLSQIQTIY
jgi:flagellar basal-body rod modification protein FlgD